MSSRNTKSAHSPVVDITGTNGVGERLTDAKKYQQALRETAARAHELQRHLQAVVDGSAGTIIFIKDLKGRFLLANRFLEQLMGVPSGSWRGKTDFDFLPKDRADYYRQHDREILQGAVCMQVEEIVLMPDGQERFFLANKFPLFDAHGQPCAVCGISVDITERKRMEQQLRQAQQDLAHANANLQKAVEERTADLRGAIEELHRFSYTIMHDMRAPLRAMHSYISLVQENCASCHLRGNMDFLRRIQASAARMDNLILDSLNYAKVAQAENSAVPVDLGTLLHSLVESYPNLLPPHADVQMDKCFPFVLGNQSDLTQCFANLLDNAVKFVAPGTKPSVRVRAERRADEAVENRTAEQLLLWGDATQAQSPTGHSSAGFVRVWVEDNGIGIPPEALQTIFGMFQRLNTSYEGTGIGLAIVKKVAERMGGKVGVESQLGKGSQFWVDLPAAPVCQPT